MDGAGEPLAARHDTGREEDEARFEPFETRLYRVIPLPFSLLTGLIFALVFGLYVLIAQSTGNPSFIVLEGPDGWSMPNVSWVGFILSLIFTAGIAFTEGGRRMWAREREALLRALEPSGAGQVEGLGRGIARRWRGRYWIAFYLGVASAIVFNLIMTVSMGGNVLRYLDSVGLWFLIVGPPLYGIGFRAAVDVARESSELKTLIRRHLEVDLFHLDRLAVFGRSGLKSARSWMIMAAILLLFLIDPANPEALFASSQLIVTIPTFLASVAGGLVLLLSTLSPVHRKIREAKAAELERIHAQMALLRPRALGGDTEAAGALAGLTDYEVWVDSRPEWPVSEGITTRLSLYVLLPILPILGSYVFEKIADQLVSGSPV